MNLINVVAKFKTEDECTDHLIAMRWPMGVCCIRCGEQNVQEMRIAASTRKNGKHIPARRLFRCMRPECEGYQFTAKAGTILDKSHLPLTKWFMAIGLITAAKKGMSALQVARHLDMEGSYKTVWYLCHRIREAMQDGGELLTGVVETDTTWMTPRKPRKGRPQPKNPNRSAVLGMIERGGKLRLVPVADEKFVIVAPVMRDNIDKDALLQTDKAVVFEKVGHYLDFRGHRMINHIISYAEGQNHTNTIENAFSLLKRGVYGTFHQVSIKHLGRYCNEFSYRFNRRGMQAEMFNATVKQLTHGKALRFKTLIASETENPSDASQ